MKAGPRLAFTLSIAAAVAACSSHDAATSEAETGTTFLAFATSFQGYRSWEKFPVNSLTTNDVHTAGPRTEYLNKRPPKGATTFPIGTIIVKELEVGAETERKVFAMVKRGGTYNETGARGWEWFELKNDAANAVTVRWRGLGPPAGEEYGGDKNGGCNTCHGAAQANDFVTSSSLSLATLGEK